MGDARGGSSVVIGGNSVVNDLHMETADNHSTVGSVVAGILSVCRQKGCEGGG